MDANIIRKYLAERAKNPTLPARYALQYARTPDVETEYPGIPWSEFSIYSGTIEGTHDGATIKVSVEADEYTEPDGSFTDRWSPDVIQHPDWRPGLYGYESVYRYYEPLVSVRENWRANRATMSRHDAYTQAVAWARRDAKNDVQPERYVLTVEATLPGGHGTDVLSGINGDPNDFHVTRDYLLAEVRGMIDIAVAEARTSAEASRRARVLHKVTVADVEDAAGRVLADDEVEAVAAKLEHGPTRLAAIVLSVTGSLAD